MDAFSKYAQLTNALRNQPCDLELVTTLTLADGTTQEITHTRRATCKKITRRKNVSVLQFADIDRSALERIFPFETFTVADFPELFVDHVGLRIPQGVGTVVKVPMAYVQKTGSFVYAGPKVIGSAATLLAVYRGTTPGQGSLVSATEYTAGTRVLASGITVNTITFTREQVDFNGRPYVIEADWTLPGSRTPSDEISRILQAYGFTIDAASFTAAANADTAAGIAVDALYGDPGRTGNATIEDLLRVARGWLSQTAAGAWTIVQDVAKASSAQFDTSVPNDLIEISEYGDGDVPATIAGQYRPKTSGKEDYVGQLKRTVGGPSGEMQLRWPYVREHVVADRLMSYWVKRLPKPIARGRVFAQQLTNGSVISVTDKVAYIGTKDFILSGISRPADANVLTMREYDAAVYTYTAGTLPADATNGYSPDYSFTPPAAPTGLVIVSQGTSADTDGKVTAYALVRAVPPTVNWARLMVQLKDTTTNEIYQAQLMLNAGNYEATVSGLRPNRVHSILCWAVNANNLDGTTATIANFTTANATTALAAPSVTVAQYQSWQVQVDLGAVADVAGQPKLRRYVLFESVGGGAYSEVKRSEERTYTRPVTHGFAYAYKARSEDVNGNESGDSSVASITPGKVVDGGYIVDASINQGRSYTGTGSNSTAIGVAPSGSDFVLDVYTFFPGFDKGNAAASPTYIGIPGSKGASPDAAAFRVFNGDATTGFTLHTDWRKFNA